MEDKKHSDPTVFIIFGASGDLTWRKLVPALYNLYLGGWMPEKFEVIGMSYDEMSDEKFRKYVLQKNLNYAINSYFSFCV